MRDVVILSQMLLKCLGNGVTTEVGALPLVESLRTRDFNNIETCCPRARCNTNVVL